MLRRTGPLRRPPPVRQVRSVVQVNRQRFLGLDVVSSVLICLVTLGTVVDLVDFYFIFINFMRVTITVRVN